MSSILMLGAAALLFVLWNKCQFMASASKCQSPNLWRNSQNIATKCHSSGNLTVLSWARPARKGLIAKVLAAMKQSWLMLIGWYENHLIQNNYKLFWRIQRFYLSHLESLNCGNHPNKKKILHTKGSCLTLVMGQKSCSLFLSALLPN